MSQFLKNTASQRVQFVMIDTNGDAVTSGITVQISKDGGALGASAGSATHLGSGLWDYVFTQAETNADHVGLVASKTGAVPIALNILTTTKLNATLSTELAAVDAKIDTMDSNVDFILTDTTELQTDWTDGGRLDLIVDAILADTGELQTDWADGGRLDLILDTAAATSGTVDQTPVPKGRTATLVRKVDQGLVSEYPLELSEGETQLIAVDFAEDMSTNGLVVSATATETSAPDGGEVTLGTPGVDKSLVKFTANPDTAGTYTVEVIATYSGSSGTAQGTVTLSVV